MYQGTVWFCRGHLLLLLSVQHILSTALITSGYEATGCVTAGAYWTHNMILSSFVYDLLLDKFLYYCSDICYCSCNSDYDSHSIGPWCVFFTRCLGMHCCAGHYVINNFLYFQEWNLHSTCVKWFRDCHFFFLVDMSTSEELRYLLISLCGLWVFRWISTRMNMCSQLLCCVSS